MNLITLLVILIVLFAFCGGGYYTGATPIYYGSGIGLVLFILLILFLCGRL